MPQQPSSLGSGSDRRTQSSRIGQPLCPFGFLAKAFKESIFHHHLARQHLRLWVLLQSYRCPTVNPTRPHQAATASSDAMKVRWAPMSLAGIAGTDPCGSSQRSRSRQLCAGRAFRLEAETRPDQPLDPRWSCSTMLLRYLIWRRRAKRDSSPDFSSICSRSYKPGSCRRLLFSASQHAVASKPSERNVRAAAASRLALSRKSIV